MWLSTINQAFMDPCSAGRHVQDDFRKESMYISSNTRSTSLYPIMTILISRWEVDCFLVWLQPPPRQTWLSLNAETQVLLLLTKLWGHFSATFIARFMLSLKTRTLSVGEEVQHEMKTWSKCNKSTIERYYKTYRRVSWGTQVPRLN